MLKTGKTRMYSCLIIACLLALWWAPAHAGAAAAAVGGYAEDYADIVEVVKQTAGLKARVITLYLKLSHPERYTVSERAALKQEAWQLCREVERFMERRLVGNRRRLVQASQSSLRKAYTRLLTLLNRKPSLTLPSGALLISQETPSDSMFPTKVHPRPLAVMIENHVKARPQAGLDKADIVYEALVEGGITRFMAVYFQYPRTDGSKTGGIDTIGPVRSCRDYFVDRSQEYDAVYVHCGSSPAGLQRLKLFQVDHLDEMSSRRAFWRDKDRKAPHNLYTSTRHLLDEIERRDIRTDTTWGFKGPVRRDSRLKGIKTLLYSKNKISSVTISYHPRYVVSYGLNPITGVYLRYINGQPHRDAVTGKQLTTPNIVLQVVDNKVLDDEGRLSMEFSGTGSATCIVGGKVVPGSWSKPNAASATRFTDKDGTDVAFRKGALWIQVVPKRANVVLGDEPPGERMTALPTASGTL